MKPSTAMRKSQSKDFLEPYRNACFMRSHMEWNPKSASPCEETDKRESKTCVSEGVHRRMISRWS
jgi:hypothetical protein